MGLLDDSDRSLTIEVDDAEEEPPSVRGGERLSGRVTESDETGSGTPTGKVSLSWSTDLDSHDGRTPVHADLQAGTDESLQFDVEVPSGPCTYRGNLFSVDWQLEASVDRNGETAKGTRAVEVQPGDGTDYQPGTVSLAEIASSGYPFEPGDFPTTPGDHPADKPGRQSTSPVGCSTFFLLGLGLVTLPLALWLGWSALMGQLGRFNTMGLLITLPLLLAAGGSLWSSIYQFWQQARYSGLRLEAEPKQVHPGDTVEVAFHYEKEGTPPFQEVRFALRRYEQTTTERHMAADDTASTDVNQESTDVDTETAWRADAAASRDEGPLHVKTTVRLPDSAPPSFFSSDCEFGWAVDVWVESENAPDWDDSVRLAVSPGR